MPRYQYHATKADGAMTTGTMEAPDQHHLAVQLQAQGLFLVTSSIMNAAPPTTPIPAAPIPVARPEKVSWAARLPGLFGATSVGQMTRNQKLLLIAIACSGFGMGGYRFYRQTHADAAPPTHTYYMFPRPHMTRQEIEKMYPTRWDKAAQTSSLTVYFARPNRIVMVSYDDQGGPWSSSNTVRGKQAEVVYIPQD